MPRAVLAVPRHGSCRGAASSSGRLRTAAPRMALDGAAIVHRAPLVRKARYPLHRARSSPHSRPALALSSAPPPARTDPRLFGPGTRLAASLSSRARLAPAPAAPALNRKAVVSSSLQSASSSPATPRPRRRPRLGARARRSPLSSWPARACLFVATIARRPAPLTPGPVVLTPCLDGESERLGVAITRG